MDTLPTEIKDNILDYLNDRELALTREINQDFKSIAEDERRWKERTYRKYGEVPQICDSWRLTYRDLPIARPQNVIVIHINNGILVCRIMRVFSYVGDIDDEIINKITDYIYDEVTGADFQRLLGGEFYYRYMEDHPDIVSLDPDDGATLQSDIDDYLSAYRRYIYDAVRHNDYIDGNGWEIGVSKIPVTYL
jgi:hypothetical protein